MYPHLPETIVYVRHPQCLHNGGPQRYDAALAQGIGNRDSPVTPRGLLQAQGTAAYLRTAFVFDRMFASDFIRTHEIPRLLGGTFIRDRRLGERWHGELHERGSAFFEPYPDEFSRYKADLYHFCAPRGETCLDVEARLADFLADANLFGNCRTVLLSGHGMSGLCLRKLLMESSVEDWYRWREKERLGNASVTVYQRHGDFFDLTLYNHKPWTATLPEEEEDEA